MRFCLLFISLGILSSTSVSFAQGNTCDEMTKLCLDPEVLFLASTGTVTEDGNDYGCLATHPNPSWFYIEIGISGDIDMELFADFDIDFIIYGPFLNLEIAMSKCGDLGGIDAPIVDCSHSGLAIETPTIPDGLEGEIYILLVTNFANVVQIATINQVGGSGSTNCDGIIDPTCFSYAGTFNATKNGEEVDSLSAIHLCEDDSFEIISNEDFYLPNDTILEPLGDGIYSAQIMWLVYNSIPAFDNPSIDPGYLNYIIPQQNLTDIHDSESEIITEFGCGTYYFVPVAGDDGLGDGGDFDNDNLTWDLDTNGCYLLGNPIEVIYACSDVYFEPLDSLCLQDVPIELIASPVGGVFSGEGVLDNSFNPILAGAGVHTLSYTYEDGSSGCLFSRSINIVVFDCLSFEELGISEITIFPNPVNDRLNVYMTNAEPSKMKVYDSVGRLVYALNTISIDTSIDVSAWKKGTYYLSITTLQSVIQKKIIIQ